MSRLRQFWSRLMGRECRAEHRVALDRLDTLLDVLEGAAAGDRRRVDAGSARLRASLAKTQAARKETG